MTILILKTTSPTEPNRVVVDVYFDWWILSVVVSKCETNVKRIRATRVLLFEKKYTKFFKIIWGCPEISKGGTIDWRGLPW